MGSIVEEIKDKKELRALSPDFVGSITQELLEKRKLNLEKKSDRKKIIKEARKVLHEVYGAFKKSKFAKRKKLLKKLKGLRDIETHNEILKLHRSTAERLPYYGQLYKKIFAVTGKPKTILDLGCGLNPLSLPYMELDKVEYYATELTEEDAQFIQDYLRKVNVKGKTYAMDLTELNTLPPADICFLFKLLDTLETLKRDVTEAILEQLNAKWTVASFPLKTLSGRRGISKKRLVWFEKIIKKHEFRTFEIPNEIFYVIKASQV